MQIIKKVRPDHDIQFRGLSPGDTFRKSQDWKDVIYLKMCGSSEYNAVDLNSGGVAYLDSIKSYINVY